jgi:hypothetical protein
MLICSYNPVATLLEDSIGTLNTEYSYTGTCWRNRRTDAIDGVCSVFCVECSVLSALCMSSFIHKMYV